MSSYDYSVSIIAILEKLVVADISKAWSLHHGAPSPLDE